MHPDIFMLSPYITLAFLVAVFLQKDYWITLLTPITWIICIVGMAISLYRRFALNDPMCSLIFQSVFGIDSDLPTWFIKGFLFVLLIRERKQWTPYGILLALGICLVYLFLVDFRDIYRV
jgi:hypothetical protein